MNKTLNDLAVEYWEYVRKTEPTDALMLGDHRYDDRFEDLPGVPRTATSPHAVTLRSERRRSIRGTLTTDEKITREVLIFLTEAQADLQEMRPAEWNVSHTIGPRR